MARGRDELLDHEYDGIREYDNPLPRWWQWLFYGSIIFAAIYTPYYLLGYGDTNEARYQAELAAAAAARPAPQTQPGAGLPAVVLDMGPEAAAAGGEIFAANCAPCHGPLGQGVIGPNLADRYWIHGGTAADIVTVITEGVPEKGMVPWKSVLNPSKIHQVTAFVLSLAGTNPPNPKAPQGELYEN